MCNLYFHLTPTPPTPLLIPLPQSIQVLWYEGIVTKPQVPMWWTVGADLGQVTHILYKYV